MARDSGNNADRFLNKRNEATNLNIIVHYPETTEKQALFDARVAKFHAEYVAQYIEKLNCSKEQKLKLLDAVINTILENLKDEGQHSVCSITKK